MDDPSPIVNGVELDAQSRCAHYHSPLDIVAIKMACCQTYYACKDCHEALADHPLRPWPATQRDVLAVLCGACRQQLTIRTYLESGAACPECGAAFNPRCENHHPFYFAR